MLYLIRYYSLCGIKDDGPLFRKFHKDKKSGNMVPIEANFSVECKVGKGSSTYMKWYAEREEQLTADGFGIFDEEGKQVFKHSMAATLSSSAPAVAREHRRLALTDVDVALATSGQLLTVSCLLALADRPAAATKV